MTRTKFARRTIVSAILGLSVVAAAQTKKPPQTSETTTPSPTSLSDDELQVLAHVHHSDEMEVKAGKLAMQKGKDQAVKSFGRMLVDDHGADARMIESMVKKQGKTLPEVKPVTERDKADMQLEQQTMSKLGALEGATFDREFLRAQVAMHDKTLAKLDRDIATIKDNGDLVQMLRGNRPVIVRHADHARTLLAAIVEAEKKR